MVPEIRGLRTGALLNLSSGSCDVNAEATMTALLEEAGVAAVEIRCVEGPHVEAALDELAAAKLDVLIVLGGDGTIRSAAEKCCAAQTNLIPLPGGTMNMLPRALYGDRPWQEALSATLAHPRVAVVGGGDANGNRFFCAGIFGAPSHWAEAREALRANRLTEAFRRAVKAYRRTFSRKIRYQFSPGVDGGSATALAVICPLTSKIMPSDAPAFEAVALNPEDLGDAFTLALNGLFSDWRQDANVTTCASKQIRIVSRKDIPALLDGERIRLGRVADIRFVPTCFNALVPEGSSVLAARQEVAL